jgi:uncharacterized protein (UPF0332 family)
MSDDGSLFQRTFEHLMDVFVKPAVTKRQLAGELPNPLELRAIQIIFYPDGRSPLVRVNGEVKALAHVTGTTLKVGRPVHEREIGSITKIELAEDERDFGHVTIIRVVDVWSMHFDFTYNKAKSKAHVDRAREFHAAATDALTANRLGVFVDNLFSASELAAKALLLTTAPSKPMKTHRTVQADFNLHAKLALVEADQKDAFNSLERLRQRGRYLEGSLSLEKEEATRLLEAIGRLIARIESYPPRA